MAVYPWISAYPCLTDSRLTVAGLGLVGRSVLTLFVWHVLFSLGVIEVAGVFQVDRFPPSAKVLLR